MFIPKNPHQHITEEQSWFLQLAYQIQQDEGYAWSWYCNLKMSMVDEGVSLETAARASKRFMKQAFNVDINDEQ